MGAWIETGWGIVSRSIPRVAPYMGAWIETLRLRKILIGLGVAPYMGAWIETSKQITPYSADLSHPIWVRGLKQKYALNQKQ